MILKKKSSSSTDVSMSCAISSKTKGDDCCTPQPKSKEPCPLCGEKTKGVLAKTVEHLLTPQSKLRLSCSEGFYYCKTSTCDVVYFRDGEILTQADFSVVVGLKEGAVPATVCYCFHWTKEKIKTELEQTGKTMALEDIKEKMENPGCSCEILNPSSGCCLGDTGKAIKEIKEELAL